MNILFCAAHPNEIKSIKLGVKDLKLSGALISFLQLGIGNSETIYTLTKYLEIHKADFIINIGICGQSEGGKGLIQVGRIVNSTGKELLVPIVFEYTEIRTIICLDKIANNAIDLNGEEFVDMESFGVEFVSSKYQIPRIILKLPADIIGEKQNIDLIKQKASDLSNIDYKLLLSKIIEWHEKQPKADNIDILKEKFHLTFQEFEIMKFKKCKYEALTKKSFMDFLEENKDLTKKEFLDKLENIFSFDY